MKKIFILVFLGLALFSCNKNGKKSGTESKKSDTTAVTAADTMPVKIDSTAPVKALIPDEKLPKGAKIVWVNIDTVQEKYQYFIDENKRMKAKLNQLDLEFAGKERTIISSQQSLQKRYEELQAKSETMSPNEMKAAEAEIQAKNQSIMKLQESYQIFKENKQAELMKNQEALNKKIRKRIDNFLTQVAEKQEWDYILTYSDLTNPILFGNKKLDVTKPVVEGLNEDYRDIKK